MQLHELRPAPGARKRRKRVGRGDGSGHGSYSGKGIKGQKARTGGGVRPGFGGGEMPLSQALPKVRGFTSINHVEYSVVNVDSLAVFPANAEVTPQALAAAGLIKNANKLVKVLGRGELTVPLKVEAHRFSRSAREKIEAAGGSVREIR